MERQEDNSKPSTSKGKLQFEEDEVEEIRRVIYRDTSESSDSSEDEVDKEVKEVGEKRIYQTLMTQQGTKRPRHPSTDSEEERNRNCKQQYRKTPVPWMVRYVDYDSDEGKLEINWKPHEERVVITIDSPPVITLEDTPVITIEDSPERMEEDQAPEETGEEAKKINTLKE